MRICGKHPLRRLCGDRVAVWNCRAFEVGPASDGGREVWSDARCGGWGDCAGDSGATAPGAETAVGGDATFAGNDETIAGIGTAGGGIEEVDRRRLESSVRK